MLSTKDPTLPGAWFDDAAADVACAWIETNCRHTEGRWFNKPFILSPWQRDIVRQIFGWKRPNGFRVYREAWLEIARKNGKSEFGAAIALLLMVAEGEPAGQVYSIAGSDSQARIVWSKASIMVALSPELSESVETFRTSLYCPEILSKYAPLSGSPRNKHGLSASGVIGDEVHEWTNREAYDAVRTSTAARDQPLAVYITTAGMYGLGLAWQLHDYAVKVCQGVIDDPGLFVVIFAADIEDDWEDPKVWAKANPNLGISPTWEYFEAEFAKAKASLAYENVFRRLHLNQWTESVTKWLDLIQWDKGKDPFDPSVLKGKRCWGGLDLARVKDLSALCLAFPPEETPWNCWAVLVWYWLPEDNMGARVEYDRVPYDQWIKAGWISTTPGNTTDFTFLGDDIIRLAGDFDLQELAYDRTFAGELVTKLTDEGIPLVEHGQGFLSMAAPTAEVERIVLGGKLRHGGNPVLRWNAANTVVRQDPAGNLKPDKEKSIERIDGTVAMIMAIGRGGVRVKPKKISGEVYAL